MKVTFKLTLDDIKQALVEYLNCNEVAAEEIDPDKAAIDPVIETVDLQPGMSAKELTAINITVELDP